MESARVALTTSISVKIHFICAFNVNRINFASFHDNKSLFKAMKRVIIRIPAVDCRNLTRLVTISPCRNGNDALAKIAIKLA